MLTTFLVGKFLILFISASLNVRLASNQWPVYPVFEGTKIKLLKKNIKYL